MGVLTMLMILMVSGTIVIVHGMLARFMQSSSCVGVIMPRMIVPRVIMAMMMTPHATSQQQHTSDANDPQEPDPQSPP